MSAEPSPPSPVGNIACPDCGAVNPQGAVLCAECNHPLDVPDTRHTLPPVKVAPEAPQASAGPAPRIERKDRPGRPERIGPNVTSFGYRPGRGSGADTDAPGVLWLVVGLAALVAVLASAIQIARQPVPLAIANASKAQLASAESLRVVLRADTTVARPNVAMGNLLYDTGNYVEAIPYYRRALRTDPTLVDVRVDMAVAYHNAGNLEAAREGLEAAVAQAPDHAVAHFDLGVVYQSLGRKAEARAQYLKAKSLDHPPGMDPVIDQLIGTLDSAATLHDALPKGHPTVP